MTMTVQDFRDLSVEPGIYPDMTNEHYHRSLAISRSGIMKFLESPYKYWADYINPNRPPKRTTAAMQFGSAFHTLLLEPQKFSDEYIVEIELERLPKVGLLRDLGRPEYDRQKAERAKIEFINDKLKEEWESKAADKILLTLEDWYNLQEMRTVIERNPEARGLIDATIYEQSYFWRDKESGLMLKARPDILHAHMIVDLKTCASANSRAYQRSMIDGGYHVQGAMIREAVNVLEGRDIPNFINLCVEKSYPYEIGIKIISEKALEAGHAKFKKALMDMKVCFETNVWPSYSVEEVDLPSWVE